MANVKGLSEIENLETIKDVDSILGYSEGYFLVEKSYPLESKKEIKEQFDLSNREVNRLLSSQKHDHKYTIYWFISKENGSIIGPFKNARLISDGVTIVNDGQVAVDTNNNILFTALEKGLEEIGDFKEDRSVATIFSENLLGTYYVYINKKGNKVHKRRYYEKANNYSEGVVFVEKYGAQCITDKKGSHIYYTRYHLNNNLSEGLISATNKKTLKTGYVNAKQKVIIDFMFEDGKPFSEGLAPVKQNGKWGYIDKQGNMIIPFIFDEAFGFSNGIAKVEITINGINRPAIIDRSGNFIIEPNELYDTIDICEDIILINNEKFVPVSSMNILHKAVLTTEKDTKEFIFNNIEEKLEFISLTQKEIEDAEESIIRFKDNIYNNLEKRAEKIAKTLIKK